jgi:tetratricopeptide (TPR) repeat protein
MRVHNGYRVHVWARITGQRERQMKAIRHVTAVLLVAAFATAGCSKSGETGLAKAGAADSAAKPVTTPATTRGESMKPTGEATLASDVIPKLTPSVAFGDGEAAYRARKYREATAIFEHYTGQRPNNPWGHYMLGLSAWKSGDLAKSEQAFEKALSLDPHHLKTLVNLSRLFIEQQRHDDAVDRLTRAADVDPESIQVYRLLARTYQIQGRNDEAVDAYRRVLELNEFDARTMNDLGLLLLEMQRADEALPLFARAMELRPNDAEIQKNLRKALEHAGCGEDVSGTTPSWTREHAFFPIPS